MFTEFVNFLSSFLSTPAIWVCLIFGSVFGSFLNVIIYRIPRGIFFRLEGRTAKDSQRSYCTSCGTLIPFYLNIPVFAWLSLRGKSACCKQPISWTYPVVEALSGFLVAFIYWRYPFVFGSVQSGLEISNHKLLLFIWYVFFCLSMIVVAFMDIRNFSIPNKVNYALMALGPLSSFLIEGLEFKDSIIGILAGGGIFYAFASLFHTVRKKEGLGLGDVKLLAAVGAWLGWRPLIFVVLIASLSGAIVGMLAIVFGKGKFSSKMPLGPFVAFASVLYLFI